MMFVHAIPLLLSVLIGLLLGLMTWTLLRLRTHPAKDAPIRSSDDLYIGLLVLAILAVGAFLIYVFLGLGM